MPKRKDAEKPGQDTKPPKAASTKRSKSKAAEPVLEEAGSGLVDVTRTRVLSGSLTGAHGNGGVVYWMSRDQRVRDNWALLHARDLALKQKKPLHVAFCLLPTFLGATLRQFSHMLAGLAEVEESLRTLKVPFVMLRGQPRDTLPGYVAEHGLSAVVTDYSPLRISKLWKGQVGEALGSVPLIEVDAHNIVPVWVASDKQEVGARTLRPRIHKHLPRYLTDFPEFTAYPHPLSALPPPVDWAAALESLEVDTTVGRCEWCKPGEKEAMQTLMNFVAGGRLKRFEKQRNDPTIEALSNLSPYLHFGQIASQRAALYVKEHGKSHSGSVASFIEEMVVRKELSDNYCHYQPQYDSLLGGAQWAQDSLQKHATDPREYLYSQEELEQGLTHDDLWNAAQLQMVEEGKMHGFLRMYWAKKILEWTISPEEALRIAIYLNDRFQLDGRDPSGYVGCMWSIVGVHDMGWAERPIFGKIRFMNYAGCKRKFKIAEFVAKYKKASKNAAIAGSENKSKSK